MAPMDFKHTKSAIDGLISTIKSLPGETKVCMECTGRYYEPMATWLTNGGLFVSAVNPKLVKDFGDESLHTPKPYLVYMTAGANKFLRIYYGTVRDYLKGKGLWPEPESQEANSD